MLAILVKSCLHEQRLQRQKAQTSAHGLRCLSLDFRTCRGLAFDCCGRCCVVLLEVVRLGLVRLEAVNLPSGRSSFTAVQLNLLCRIHTGQGPSLEALRGIPWRDRDGTALLVAMSSPTEKMQMKRYALSIKQTLNQSLKPAHAIESPNARQAGPSGATGSKHVS